MIDGVTRKQQRERRLQHAQEYYAAHRDEILAKKRIRDHSRTRSAAAEKALQDRRRAKVYIRPTRWCLECGETLPDNHRPHDYCNARHQEIAFWRTYGARALPFLPPCERQRR